MAHDHSCGIKPPATQVPAHNNNENARAHRRPILFIKIQDIE